MLLEIKGRLTLNKRSSSGCTLFPWYLHHFPLQQGGNEFVPVVVNRAVLKTLDRSHVVVKRWPAPLRYQYFKSIMPDVSVTVCASCNQVRCGFVFSWMIEMSLVWMDSNTLVTAERLTPLWLQTQQQNDITLNDQESCGLESIQQCDSLYHRAPTHLTYC